MRSSSQARAAIIAQRVAAVASPPAGGWTAAGEEQQTMVWPYAEIEIVPDDYDGMQEATVIETIHANNLTDAESVAASIVDAVERTSYNSANLYIASQHLTSGPRIVRRVGQTTVELQWRVHLVWRT